MSQRKLRLSPTRITTYLSCQIYYRYEYLDRIGRYYHKALPGYAFGSTLHRVLQQFHKADGVRHFTMEQLLQSARDLWQSAGYTSSDEENKYRNLAVEILSGYYRQELGQTRTRETFASEKQVSMEFAGFVLTGRVDRIVLYPDTNELEIVDYKSGRETVTSDDVRNALAMSTYQLLVRRTWPEYNNVVATIYALRGNTSASVSLSDDELLTLESTVSNIGNEIISTEFQDLRPTFMPEMCPACDFYRVCLPYFKQQGIV